MIGALTARVGSVLLLLAALPLAACSPSITIVSSVRPPGVEPLNLRGEKVAAVVMMENQKVRRQAEAALARAISDRGVRGIPMYTMLASPNPADQAAARAVLEQNGVKGIIAMRPTRARKTERTPAQTYTMPMYSGYWGGYYGYGWGSPWGAPVSPYGKPQGPEHGGAPGPTSGGYYVPVTVDVPATEERYTVVKVEILVYSLKQNQLVWAGETESTEPSNVDDYVLDLVEATAKELAKVRLIPG
jgi:hypothetical protein